MTSQNVSQRIWSDWQGSNLHLAMLDVRRHFLGSIYVNIFIKFIGLSGLPGIYAPCLTAWLVHSPLKTRNVYRLPIPPQSLN